MAPIRTPKTHTKTATSPYRSSSPTNVIKDSSDFIPNQFNPQQAEFLEKHINLILPLLPDTIDICARLSETYHRQHSVKRPQVLDKQPAGLRGTLTPYQMKGLDFLIHLHRNKMPAILADDMGLGKTVQVIALIWYLICDRQEYPNDMRQHLRPSEPYLIVVPLSTLGNWKTEINKWCNMDYVEFHGEKDKTRLLKKRINGPKEGVPTVVLTTYEQVLKDKHFFMNTSWRYLILDEAHRAKNSKSDTWKVLSVIPTKNRLCMSGTPIQNNLEELWSLLAFLYPQVFKNSATQALFKKAFDPSKSQSDQTFFQKVAKFLDVIMLRRTKEDVKEFLPLPPKTEVRMYVPLTAYQKELYLQGIKQNVGMEKIDIFASTKPTDQMKDSKRDHQKLSNLLQHLRKICTHPFLVTGEEPDPLSDLGDQLVTASGKFIALETIIRDTVLNKKRKLVIFSSFTQTLKHCETLLKSISADRAKFQWCSIVGKLHRTKRNLNIRLFQDVDSDYRVMLVSTKAGGEGINLTAAQDSVFIDEDWNPQSTLQAESRTHRMGQTGNVTIYKICTQGTVEEQMLKRIYKKLYLSTKIMDQVGSSRDQNSTTEGDPSDLDMSVLQRMHSSDIAKLIRIGTTALVHDDIDIEDMMKWDLDTLVSKCRGKVDDQVPSHPDSNQSSSSVGSDDDDEQLFLKSQHEIKAQVFQGQNLGGDPKSKKRKREEGVDLILDHSERRNGKHTTVMVDGYAVKKVNLGHPTTAPVVEPAQADPERKKFRGKAKVTARQTYCGCCLDPVTDTDPTCYACPRSYHVACTGEAESFFTKRSAPWSCKQHQCADCGLKAAKTGGFTHRCRTCEKGFCDDCIAKEWSNCVNIGDSLPEFEALGYPAIEQAWYVICPDCCQDPERVAQALALNKPVPKLKLKGWSNHEELTTAPASGQKRKSNEEVASPTRGSKRAKA